MEHEKRYSVLGMGERTYSFSEIARMTADGVLASFSRICEGDGEWAVLNETVFGTMLPRLNAGWNRKAEVIARRFKLLMTVFNLLCLLCLVFFFLLLARASVLFAGIFILTGLLLARLLLGCLFFHLWGLVPYSRSRIPPFLRVILWYLPLIGAFWAFNLIFKLSCELERLSGKPGPYRNQRCTWFAFAACAAGILVIPAVFFAPAVSWIFFAIYLICLLFSLKCMTAQAIRILEKRLKSNQDMGSLTPRTEAAPELEPYLS